MSLWLGNRTSKGKGVSCFDLTLQQFREGGKSVGNLGKDDTEVLCPVPATFL